MKILLLGGTGLLGSEFHKIFKEKNFDFLVPPQRELDLTDFEAVDRFLAHEYFDRIMYCAGYTDVDNAETERGKCEMMNIRVLENLLVHQVPIVHFSTDYVFNAPAGIEIPENFERNPINFYGETKLHAEKLLENSDLDFWNIRTSWLFGSARENFVTKILNAAKEKEVLRIVDNQIGRPTYAKDLAEFVTKYFLENEQPSGHYHLQNIGEPVSWAGFAEYFLKKENADVLIEKISSDELVPPRPAARPKNSVLGNTKLPENLRDWREAVDEFLA